MGNVDGRGQISFSMSKQISGDDEHVVVAPQQENGATEGHSVQLYPSVSKSAGKLGEHTELVSRFAQDAAVAPGPALKDP